jgi:adenosylcobinamide kinase/adenosylcobinamide-phosphate guanylyltransferase
MKRLILGGVKSGKSRFAEQQVKQWLEQSGRPQGSVIYLATAEPQGDDEMHDRIALHRAQRPSAWQTLEIPFNIAEVIENSSGQNQCLLIECLTLWMSNLLHRESSLSAQVDRLCSAVENYEGEIIMVSNETGLGIMPVNALARRFGDEVGLLHQRLAVVCDEVVLTVAGLPQYLKTNKAALHLPS